MQQLIKNRAQTFICKPIALCLVLAAASSPLLAATVLSPSGAAYTQVSASGQFSPAYAPTNLFNHDVTDLALGVPLEASPGKDWAILGVGPGYVRFELDQVFQVGSVFYAQRIGGDPGADKIDQMSVWASTSSPFNATDPGTLPLAVLAITNQQSGIWCEYPLASTVTGRYFLIKVEQHSSSGGNIGGNELRLGMATPDTTPPTMVFLYPVDGATIRSLTSVEVGFSEPVAGVEAAGLLLNGRPATSLTSVTPSQFIFNFPQPATGAVSVAWAPGNGIHDLSSNSNAFSGGSWLYTLNPNAPQTGVIISEFMASNGGKQTNSVP